MVEVSENSFVIMTIYNDDDDDEDNDSDRIDSGHYEDCNTYDDIISF
jgi:hypothetical protein